MVYCTAGWHYAFSGGLYIDGVRRGQRDRLRSGEVASDQGVRVIVVHRGTVTVLDIPYHPFRPPLSGLSMTHPELDCIEKSVDGVMGRLRFPDAHVASVYPCNL